MKPVFKCDYCNFMGTEEEVREHEPKCIYNYDRKSCYTCKHRNGLTKTKDNEITYKCMLDKDIPFKSVYEFCPEYERKEINPLVDLLTNSWFR